MLSAPRASWWCPGRSQEGAPPCASWGRAQAQPANLTSAPREPVWLWTIAGAADPSRWKGASPASGVVSAGAGGLGRRPLGPVASWEGRECHPASAAWQPSPRRQLLGAGGCDQAVPVPLRLSLWSQGSPAGDRCAWSIPSPARGPPRLLATSLRVKTWQGPSEVTASTAVQLRVSHGCTPVGGHLWVVFIWSWRRPPPHSPSQRCTWAEAARCPAALCQRPHPP